MVMDDAVMSTLYFDRDFTAYSVFKFDCIVYIISYSIHILSFLLQIMLVLIFFNTIHS